MFGLAWLGLAEDFSNMGGSPQKGDVGSAGDQICALTLRGKPMGKKHSDPKGKPQRKCNSPCFTVFPTSPCIEIGWKHLLTLPE